MLNHGQVIQPSSLYKHHHGSEEKTKLSTTHSQRMILVCQMHIEHINMIKSNENVIFLLKRYADVALMHII